MRKSDVFFPAQDLELFLLLLSFSLDLNIDVLQQENICTEFFSGFTVDVDWVTFWGNSDYF